jgi:hypothetical protein
MSPVRFERANFLFILALDLRYRRSSEKTHARVSNRRFSRHFERQSRDYRRSNRLQPAVLAAISTRFGKSRIFPAFFAILPCVLLFPWL